MKKLISMILCLTLCLSATLALAQESKTITIGATPEPHASILELIKEDFEKLGYVLDIKVSQDYYYFNPVTADGDLDCNFFQHEAFLNQDYNNNAEEGKKLVNVCAVHYEPLGIYAGTKTDLAQIADGDVISVPNDGSNYTRALFLLQDAGLIKLREGVTAFDALTIDDVAEKIVNIEIKDMNADLQAIALEDDGPDLVLRWAALLHDIGKPSTRRHEADGGVSFHHHEVVGTKMVRKRLRALKFSKQMIDDVSQLVYLHLRFHGYGDGKWTDSAVRRYVTDAGPLLPRLHKLVRADCTTRNKRRAARLRASYDRLEARIAELAAQEDLARVRPDLDGNQIMELLGIPAGPQVGEAWRFLKELRLERGPLSTEEATAELLSWWQARGNPQR